MVAPGPAPIPAQPAQQTLRPARAQRRVPQPPVLPDEEEDEQDEEDLGEDEEDVAPARVPSAPAPAPSAPAPPAPAAPATGQAVKAEGKFVGLNFDYADINVVIQTIAELIGMNYILSPGISGKVTIQTAGKIATGDLFFVLEKILEVNNLTAVKSGDFYKIIPLGAVNKEALPTVPPEQKAPQEQTVIKIFKLKYITPSEAARIFGSLKSPQGVFIAHDPASILFVLETGSRIQMFTELIESVDTDIYRNIQVELYPVANAQAEELSKDLTQVITAVTTVPGRPAARYRLIPVKAINSLLLVTTEPGLGELVRGWIRQLDQPASTEAEKVFVYNLNHASAENVASILRELYSEKGTSVPARTAPGSTPVAPGQAGGVQLARAAQAAAPAAETASTEGVSGKVKVVADKDTNSLIIQTAPWNYPSIVETIKKLDKSPEQVLIEVTIAEITLDDTDQLGIEWALKSQGQGTVGGERFNFSGTAQNIYNTSGVPAASVPGFSYLLTEAGRITAVLNAYAKASKLNIVSRPHIMASDNKEAKIDIGQEVPIITSKQTSTETTSSTQTIEYRSTGVILTVTPHINENRDVTLDVTQEVSEAQTNRLGGTDSPIIIKRTAKTSMVVRDNETLIIGGLIQEKKERSREGIPILSRIPILGYLFGATTDAVSKTELVVLMTPRVITTVEEGARLTDEYRDRTLILKKGIKQP